jgi:hypothetical protein
MSMKAKRKLKPAVWEDFHKIEVDGKWKAKCKWCKKSLSAEGTSGTTHLHNHVSSCDSRQDRKGLKLAIHVPEP